MLTTIEIMLIIILLSTLSKLNDFVYFRNFREFDRRFNFLYIISKTILFSTMSVLSVGLIGKFIDIESSTLIMMKFTAGYATFIKSAFHYSTDLERIKKQTLKVFVDIDGVLNSTNFIVDMSMPELLKAKEEWKKKYDTYIMSPLLIETFIKSMHSDSIYDRFKYVDFVLSSTWRIAGSSALRRINFIFKEFNRTYHLPVKLVDATEPYPSGKTRGAEIETYMSNYAGVDYIIIDDDNDFTDEQKANHLFRTDERFGFCSQRDFEKFMTDRGE